MVGTRPPSAPTADVHASREYWAGFGRVGLEEDRLPNLKDVSERLLAESGRNATPINGFLPARAFFEMLVARKFPTTTWLRGRADLEYTPKPDIFHDVFGYVPMHAHAIFLQRVPSVMAACVRRSTIARCANVLSGFFGIPSSLA